MSPVSFDNIKRCAKRAEHFAGSFRECPAEWGDWAAVIPSGTFPLVENYWLMQETPFIGRTRQEQSRSDYVARLEWLDALASSLNRWMDANRVEGNRYFIYALRWFQQHLFFEPGEL